MNFFGNYEASGKKEEDKSKGLNKALNTYKSLNYESCRCQAKAEGWMVHVEKKPRICRR